MATGRDRRESVAFFGRKLIEVLTRDELKYLCDMFDNGMVDQIFHEHLLPEAAKNFPEDYDAMVDDKEK